MRIIEFLGAILLAGVLSGCVTEASRETSRNASISPSNGYKIIVVPVPVYLSKPDQGDEDGNSGEVIRPERAGHAVHAQLLKLSQTRKPRSFDITRSDIAP